MNATLRTARSIAVGLLAATIVVFVAPMAAGASTPSVVGASPRTTASSTLELGDSGVTVETSNKVSWSLIVSWNNIGTPVLGIGLQRIITSPSSGVEFHQWNFDVSSSSFTFNDKTGTLNSGTQSNPVASVDLNFKTTSSKAATCTSGKETIYEGTLSGKASLVTGLTGGGTVSGTYNFNLATPQVEVDQGCVAPPGDECGASLIAGTGNTSGPALTAGSLGTTGAPEQIVGVEEDTDLSSPKGGTRSDLVALDDESGKVFATYTGKEVKIASTGIVTGTGAVTGGKPTKEPPESCSFGGKNYTDTSVVDDPATYSGKFSAKPSIGTTLTVAASSKTAFYLVTTSKKA